MSQIAKKNSIVSIIEKVESAGFEELMPKKMRAIKDRFIRTAQLYLATANHREKLMQCTETSIIGGILQAAKHGLLLDGKQSHLVPYNTKIKGADGKEHWESLAQWQPDYKGLVAATKRMGTIKDCFAEHVYENDSFERELANGKWDWYYRPTNGDRGDYVGCFAVVVFPDDHTTLTWMTLDEINSIKARSKGGDNGPWKTDETEMRKKTVIKRALKLHVDDIDLIELFAADDDATGIVIDTVAEEPKKGARKAAPLSLGYDDNPREQFEVEQSEREPVERTKAKPKSEPKQEINAVEFAHMFAHCKTSESIDGTLRDILQDDPFLKDNEAFRAAVMAKREEVAQ